MKKKTDKKEKFALSWPEKATFELTITIPKEEIKKEYQQALKAVATSVSLPGFRKGKAPLSVVEEKVGKQTILGELVKRLIPRLYQEALTVHHLHPILDPKVQLISTQEGKDWVVKITSCVMPEIKLGNYKEEIKKINAKAKIWTPEKGEKQPSPEQQQQEKEARLQTILQKLMETVPVQIPSLLIETEVQKKLVQLIDQLQKAGLTIEQYLQTKGQTMEEFKGELARQIGQEWKLEFILTQIAEKEKITVDKEELEAYLKREKEQTAGVNPYLLAQLLRRQKTIEYLLNL